MFINNTVIDAINDNNNELSLKSIGLLTLILSSSVPVSIPSIVSLVSDEKHSVRSAFRTLEKRGIIYRVKGRDSCGRFSHNDIVFTV